MQIKVETRFNVGDIVYHKVIPGPEGENLKGVVNQLIFYGNTHVQEARVSWETTQESVSNESELLTEEEFKLNRII